MFHSAVHGCKQDLRKLTVYIFSVLFCIVGLKMQMLYDEKMKWRGVNMNGCGDMEEGFDLLDFQGETQN